jgi:hypothetical protein
MRTGSGVRRWLAAIVGATLVSAAAAVGTIVLGAAGARSVGAPVVKIGGPAHQRHPGASGDLVIWTERSERRPRVDHAYWKVLGADGRVRIDGRDRRGAAGGIEPPDGLRAIYQQMTATDSNLWWYRFEDGARSRVAIEGVNTDRWERDPRVSASFLLFAREAGDRTSVFLVDRAEETVERIAAYDRTRYHVVPGAVGDRWATWTTCGPFTCTAWSYDAHAADPQPRKLPSDGRPQYAPVIDEVGGWVYTVRSARACGETVGIWRRAWPIDPDVPADRLVLLPDGIDVGFTLSLDRSSGTRVDLWFSRHRCASDQGDVAVLRDVETVP